MRRVTKPKSLRLIALYRRARKHAHDARYGLFCGEVKTAGHEYSDAQRARMSEANKKVQEAVAIADDVFADMIGKSIVDEIANGGWR